MDPNPTFIFTSSGGYPRNNQLPPRKRYRSFTPEQHELTDETDTNPPPKRQQFAVPKDVIEGSASRTITTWRKLHEISILKSILEYRNQYGTYPFDDSTHMQRFYKSWMERSGVFVDEDVFSTKMVELPERFFRDQDKTFVLGQNVKAWMPRVDARIYELSHMIWGGDDGGGGGGDGGDGGGGGEDDGGVCVDPES